MKKQTKKTAATPAKSKGKAKPPATPPPRDSETMTLGHATLCAALGLPVPETMREQVEERLAALHKEQERNAAALRIAEELRPPRPAGAFDPMLAALSALKSEQNLPAISERETVRRWDSMIWETWKDPSPPKDPFPALAERCKQNAADARRRADILRTITGWVRGDSTPPDGATRADVLFRGISWDGWEWNLRGVNVTESLCEAGERDAARWWLALHGHEAEALAARRALDEEPQDESEHDKRFRKSMRDFFREHDFPVILPSQTAAREAAEDWLAATQEERAAWREIEAASIEAQDTLPADELAAAKARLDGSSPPSPSNPAPVADKDADAARGGEKTPEQLAAAAIKYKKREAVKAWRAAHAERNRRCRITRESREEKWADFWNWIRKPGSGFRDIAGEVQEEEFWRILDSVRHG